MSFLSHLVSAVRPPSVPEISVAEVAASGDWQIVDVREPAEWQSGTIGDAHLIPLSRLAMQHGTLDASRPTVVVCRSGNRSKAGTSVLQSAGFTDVRSMAGGMITWTQAKLPTVRNR